MPEDSTTIGDAPVAAEATPVAEVGEEADTEADEEVVEEDEDDEYDMLGGAEFASGARARPLSKDEARAAMLSARASGSATATAAGDGAAEGDPRGELVLDQLTMEETDEAVPRFAFSGQFIEPSDAPEPQPGRPPVEVELEWIHGYRGWDCRNNVHYVLDGAAVAYPAAAVVVLNNGGSQSFFDLHDDDVLSMAVHPDGRTIASGQIGRMAKVLVWNAETKECSITLEGVAERAARHLAFSGDGKVLAVAGEDNNHTVALYHWEDSSRPFAVAQAGTDPTNAIALNHDGSALLTVGKNKAMLHSGSGGAFSGSSRHKGPAAPCMKAKKVLMNGKGKLQVFWSAAFLADGGALIGTHSGRVYEVRGRAVAKAHRAHSGPVTSISVQTSADGGEVISTASKDGTVHVFRGGRISKPSATITNASEDAGSLACMRACSVSPDGAHVAYGTRGGAVRIADIAGDAEGDAVTLVRSHHTHELWGLALSPDNDTIVTTGDDKSVRLWSISGHAQIASANIGIMARAAAVSHDGSLVAVGCGGRVGILRTGTHGKDDGTVVILSMPDLTEVARVKPSRQWISDVKFSPDDKTLAVASHDNKLYLLDVDGGYTVRGAGSKSPSFLTRVDWSASGEVCRVTTGAHEVLFYDGASGAHIPGGAASCKDEVWDTVTCSLNWHTQGVWPSYADGTDINGVAVDTAQSIIASGDDFGRVRLFRFPCIEHDLWESIDLRGHSSHVTNVAFSAPESDGGVIRLLSAGGNDKCLMQWRLTPIEDELAGRTDIGNL